MARAAVTITWPYDEEHLNYIEKPVAVTPPNVNTPDGRAHPGAITYEYRVKGEETYQPGLPRNVGTYYVRAAVAEAGNYQGAATGVDLELVIEKQPVTLLLEDYTRTYDGTAVTMEDIPKEARGYLGDTLAGTWTLKDGAPEMKEPGTYSITLIFTPEDPNYTWSERTIQVTVRPIDLTDATLTVTGSYTYNAKAQIPADNAVTVTLNGETIPASEYELSYENNTNAGQAVVTARGLNHHGGTARGEFTIAPIQLTLTALTVGSRKYDATQKVPVEKLELAGILDADKDRVGPKLNSVAATVASANVGTYSSVTLSSPMELEGEAKDNYLPPAAGTVVEGKALNDGKGVTIDYAVITFCKPQVADKEYDGTTDARIVGSEYSIEPFSLPWEDLRFSMDVAFVSTAPGYIEVQGTVTLDDTAVNKNYIFKNGERTSPISKTYASISPRPVEVQWSTPQSFLWDGQEHSVSATITNLLGDDDVTLVCEGTSGVDAKGYTAKITGLDGPDKNKYTLGPGRYLFCNWQIQHIDISDAEVTLSETEYVYDGKDHKPEITVQLKGDTLTEGEDYSVKLVGSTVNAGTITVVINGIHNHDGVAHASYTINPLTVTPVSAELETKIYDGTVTVDVKRLTFDGLPDTLQPVMHQDYNAWAKFDNADAGTGKTVTVEPHLYGNYRTTQRTFTLTDQTILPKEATVSVQLDPTDCIYVHEELPTASLAYTGLVGGQSLAPAEVRVDGMPTDTATAGEYTLTVSQATREAILALDAARNYQITFADKTLTILNDTMGMLPDEYINYRLGQSELTEVPAELAGKYNGVDDIQDAMFQMAVKDLPGVTAEQTALYDVALYYTTDGGRTWSKATQENFPEEGITVTLPYPAGTNAADFDFVVTHMMTAGAQAGQVETPAVTKTDKGLRFTVYSLSPIAVSWKAIPKEAETATGGTAVTPAPTAAPDDTAYYTCPACGHHDWTATEEGYRCNHCGHLESVKQLAGHPNVEGVYEPKTTDSTASTTTGSKVSIPQTGDDSRVGLWLSLLALSGTALAAMAIRRKRRQ